MGLGSPPRLPADMQRRSYLTVIRRNWHLLPYDQLCNWLDWSAEQMAFTLREDDFFYIKLGSLKPECAPLRWEAPDAGRGSGGARRRSGAGQFCRSGARGGNRSLPLSSVVRPSSKASRVPRRPQVCAMLFVLRALRRSAPGCGRRFLSGGYLARLADAGVNGVWLHGLLHKLAPSLAARTEPALGGASWKSGRLVERARRQGLKVFLYLNEPRPCPAFSSIAPAAQGSGRGGSRRVLHLRAGGAHVHCREPGHPLPAGARPGRLLHHHRLGEPNPLLVASCGGGVPALRQRSPRTSLPS